MPQKEETFFHDLNAGASQIIKHEKLQEEYHKQFKVQSVMEAKFTAQLEQKDKEIDTLKQSLQMAEDELMQVKKRNKQLCFILAQGEMKDKAEILQQVENLTQIKDELSDQLVEMSTELEKERSKVYALKGDKGKK